MSPADGGARTARTLLALAHEELELVESGRHEELAAIDVRRQDALTQLPARLSPDARALLDQTVEAQREVAAALTIGLARVRDELGRVSHGRTAMAGYAPAGLDARPVLDQSA
jgi:hypothetical protein